MPISISGSRNRGWRHRARASPSSGFTLIELAVVVCLVSLFLGLAVPRVEGFLFRGGLNGAARSMKASVRYLRSKSILTGEFTALCFDLDRNAYSGEYEPAERTAGETGRAGAPLIPPETLPEDVRFLDVSNIREPKRRTGELRSVLNPKGVIEETVIHLADDRGRRLTLVINAYTGRFSIHEGYVDLEYARRGED